MRNLFTFSVLLFLIASNNLFAQSIPSYISTTGLLVWYPFTGNANNGLGTGKNGVPMGATLTTDRFGTANSAYSFNGITNHITIDTPFFNNAWSNYAVSVWIYSDSTHNPNNGYDVGIILNTIPCYGWAMSYNYASSGKYDWFVNRTPAITTWNILPAVQSNQSIVSRTWKHLAFVKSNDTAYSMYIDGVLDSTFISHTLPLTYESGLVLGSDDSSVGNFGFWGKLDDYGVWNRALAACEVRRLYHSSAYTYLTGQPATTVSAVYGTTAHFQVTDTGTGNTFQWQGNAGAGFVNLSNIAPYSGVTTPTLTVTSVTMAVNNNKYRCIVSGAYPCTDSSAYGTLLITVGVNNVNAAKNISIAPNPTTGNINVLGAGKVTIRIYNCIGQQVGEALLADKISVANLPTGMYVVKLFDETGALLQNTKVLKE